MIREISKDKINQLYEFLQEDIARNYFILLGLLSKKEMFEVIFGEFHDDKLLAALFKRKSGTFQFYAPKYFDIDGFSMIMSELEFNCLIGPKSYSDLFLNKGVFSIVKDQGYISKLKRESAILPIEGELIIKELMVEDLDQVIELYDDVFHSYASKELMEERINQGRGRGYYIEANGELLSVVQTEFETKDAAVIVGVATNKYHRNKGLASELLKYLINCLLREGKDIFLQYDNLDAGRIYEKMGFKVIDHISHYYK